MEASREGIILKLLTGGAVMSLYEEINALEKRVKEITKNYRINICDLDEYRSSRDRIKELRSMLNSMR